MDEQPNHSTEPLDWRKKQCSQCGQFRFATGYGGENRKWSKGGVCPNCHNAGNREYYERNKDRLQPVKRERARLRCETEPEKIREIQHRFQRTEKGRANGRRKSRKRRALRNNAICEHGPKCFDEAGDHLPTECLVDGCQNTDIEADHWMPLALGGLHCQDNCRPLCQWHNRSKHDSHPDEWMARHGIVLR